MKETLRPAIGLASPAAGVDELLEHGDYLHRMVNGLLGDSHDSDDVVQQTWLAVLTATSEPVRKPKTWLARIAKNRSIDMIRRKRVRVVREQAADLPAPRPGPDEEIERDSVRSTISQAVERLGEPYRTSIELRFFEGLPPREVARRMGVPVETVRTRIKRALASLRTRLDADFPGGRQAWVVAFVRWREREAARLAPPATPRGWRPVTVAAGLAMLLFAGGGHLRQRSSAEASDAGDRAALRTVSNEPVLDWQHEAAEDEDALGRGSWDAWPPEPAVEVGRARRHRGLEEGPGQGSGTWAALREEPLARPPATRPPEAAPAAPPPAATVASFTPTPPTWVAGSIDESTPLDVSPEERIAPGRVWTVDPSGGGSFLTLGEAAAAASSGDVLLLAPSTQGYEELSLRGKGLSVLGDGDLPVLVRGVSLRGLAANENVVLKNLRVVAPAGRSAVSVEDVRGSVWIEDSALAASDADGLRIEDSAAVALLRTSVTAQGHGEAGGWIAAVSAFASDVSVVDSELVGGPGRRWRGAGPIGPGHGAHGAVVTYGRLFAMGSRFEGGSGSSEPVVHARGGDGGAGLWVEGEARVLGCAFAGGAAGRGLVGTGAEGVERIGPIEDLGGTLRRYAVHQRGSTTTLTAEGRPGDVVMSVLGGAPSKGYLLLHLGTRLVAPPYAFSIEGVVPANGRFEKRVEIPSALALGGAFERYYVQGFFFAPHGEAYLAGASTLFVLP